jgi:nitrate reductase NapAB chaperone NapD
MSSHTVTMHIPERSARADQAVDELAAALPEAEVTEPDENGIFDIVVEADDQEVALEQIWDAVAATGADDHVVFAEHADIPEHWRERTAR